MPGGALAVPHGDEIVPLVNRLGARFANVVLTQDWHPRDHISFASSHPGRKPFETIHLGYGDQVLWPPHCVQGTHGAALHAKLDLRHAQLVIRKGHHRDIDSYSAFLEADRKTSTGNQAVLITGNLIAGFAGPNDDVPITYAGHLQLIVDGSDSSTLAERFQIESPAAPLTLHANAGNDAITIRSLDQAAIVDALVGKTVAAASNSLSWLIPASNNSKLRFASTAAKASATLI